MAQRRGLCGPGHLHVGTLARQATHPIPRPPQLEPGLEQCIDLHNIIRGSLTRGDMNEVDQTAEDRMYDTLAWWKALPPHVAQVYDNKEHDQISHPTAHRSSQASWDA